MEGCDLSHSSKLTKGRILRAAKAELLQYSFPGATLRAIAKRAGVTTGALYNHFDGKEQLFEAIVGPFASRLLALFEAVHERVTSAGTHFSAPDTEAQMAEGSFEVLAFCYAHLDEARLLFFHANGTKYEDFASKLVDIEERASLQALEEAQFELSDVNRFLVHVLSHSGVHNMLEALHHGLSEADAMLYMQKIQRFYYAGVQEILGP